MGRFMAIVSHAWLTKAIIGVTFLSGGITIAKASSLGMLMHSRTVDPFITCYSWKKKLYCLAKNHAYFFVMVSCLFG